MRRLFLILLLLTGAALAQGVRIGDGIPVASTLNLNGVGTILTPSSTASISVCAHPANAVPCTNKATTYTSITLGTPCATSVQVTLPGTTSCVANADSLGNWGAWVAAGDYDYTITVGSHSYGPYAVTAAASTPTVAFAASAGKDAVLDKAFINAVTDCGVPSDTVSDICSTMQACMDTYPSYKIGLPQLVASGTGGGTATPQSYYSSCRLTLKGNGQKIAGMGGPSNYLGGVVIKFAPGVGGFTQENNCVACGFENLYIKGGNASNPGDITTYEDFASLAALKAGTYDGVYFTGAMPWMENVKVSEFKGNGVGINGDSGFLPDGAHFKNVNTSDNRGCGLFVWGADANVGHYDNIDSRSNNVCGIWESTFYGNKWDGGHTTGQTSAGKIAVGTTQAISSISVSGGVCSLTTTASLTNGVQALGTWVITAGTSGGVGFDSATYTATRGQPGYPSFLGAGALVAAKVLSVNSGTKTITYNCPATGGPASGGTVRTASSGEVIAYYSKNGIRTGSFVADRGAPIVDNFYAEGFQAPVDAAGTLFTGGESNFSVDKEADQANWIYPSTGESLLVRTKTMVFDLRANGIFRVSSADDLTAYFTIDPLNNRLSSLSPIKIGVSPLTYGAVSLMPGFGSTLGIYSKSTLSPGSAYAMMYMDTADDRTVIGDINAGARVQHSLKIGASGSAISDSRELIQNAHSCGTTTTCANTANGANRIVFGSATMTAGTVTVTGITAFTSTSSYFCSGSNQTTAAAFKIANTSTTSITITGTGTDVIAYQCIGN